MAFAPHHCVDKKPPQPRLDTTHRGKIGETVALGFLERSGLWLVARNFRWKGGEIDLVLMDHGHPMPDPMNRLPLTANRDPNRVLSRPSLVFAEVRSASRGRAPLLRYSIGAAKRRRLRATASTFVFRNPSLASLPVRFDFVWVEGERIEHWRNVIV